MKKHKQNSKKNYYKAIPKMKSLHSMTYDEFMGWHFMSYIPVKLEWNTGKIDDGEEALTYERIIASPEKYNPEIITEKKLRKEIIDNLINSNLSPREQIVIRRLYGINQYDIEDTSDKIAVDLDLAVRTINKIHLAAIRKLRLTLQSHPKLIEI